MAPGSAPPSYTEATRHPTSKYLASRVPPPQDVTSEPPLICSISPSQQNDATSIMFPNPEFAWKARDVDSEDWAAFVAELSTAPGAVPSDQKTPGDRPDNVAAHWPAVIDEWNTLFFAARGCRVDILEPKALSTSLLSSTTPTSQSGLATPATTDASETGVLEGAANSAEAGHFHGFFGLKFGRSFLGVAVGKENSNGVGLKLGDVLIGVANAPSEKK